jgi:lysophospholipase
MRPLLALLCAVCLCACSDPAAQAPFTASRIPAGLPIQAWPPEGWAWGLIKLGDGPALRYGVGAPPVVPRGQVMILPDYGEPAEAWFAPAQALIDRGYSVWTLDLAGQGGSGRYGGLGRDVGHAPDFQLDVQALKAMVAVMDHRPAVLLAQGQAAPVLIEALRQGLPAQGAVLSAPVLSPPFAGPDIYDVESAAPFVQMAHLGWLRALGQSPWSAREPGRAGLALAWQTANPELRIGGPSFGYIAAFDAQTAAIKGQNLGAIRTPVLILPAGPAPSADERALCARLARCSLSPPAPANPVGDRTSAAWTRTLAAFIDLTRSPVR